MKIARLTLSDRASQGVYTDLSGPEIERVIENLIPKKIQWLRVLLPDNLKLLQEKLIYLCDVEKCPLVLTTGGTGPYPRDITPEATLLVIKKELLGFGEIMRMKSYEKIKTSILSRATAGIRGQSLIINLPGKPSSIEECLPLLIPSISELVEDLKI